MTGAPFYEALQLRPGFEVLAGYVTTAESPLDANPRQVYANSLDSDYSRLVALMYANYCGDTLIEAEINLLCILAFAARGRRPRSLTELGLVPS